MHKLFLLLSLSFAAFVDHAGADNLPPPNTNNENISTAGLVKIQADLEAIKTKVYEKQEDTWNKPSTLISAGAVIITLISLGFSFTQFRLNRKDQQRNKDRELRADRQATLLNSLNWFEGGIQKRAIGIGIIEGHWPNHPELWETWASILLTQAVYIINKPDKSLPEHEIRNLRRILGLLKRANTQDLEKFGIEIKRTITEAFHNACVGDKERNKKSDNEEEKEIIKVAERQKFIRQIKDVSLEYPDLFDNSTHPNQTSKDNTKLGSG